MSSIAQAMRLQKIEQEVKALQEQVQKLTDQLAKQQEKRPPGRPKNASR